MFSNGDLPSPSSIFSAYASMTASVMLLRSVANDIIPQPLRAYLLNAIRYFIKPSSPLLTLVIEESSGIARNQVYDAAEIYLSARLTPDNERLKVSKSPKEKTLMIRLEKGERLMLGINLKLIDCYDGVELKWRFICSQSEKNGNHPNDLNTITVRSENRFFELCFHKKHKEMVLGSYLPFILEKAKLMKDQGRVLKMHTLNSEYCYPSVHWDSINLEHPSTFDTLAMEPELKNAVMEDLNRFLRRKEFYKRVGRAWKRGYLLYGPPGTGKSSLIAAMANYLKFDIYDLQLVNILRDSDFRRLLLATANRSILVIEDIDCTVDLTERRNGEGRKQTDVQRTLSGLLNFIDGLWSSCGDERIIIFTTNHKERLDPALLRPGRMDMHINMSYCTYHAFKHLASNYLGLSSDDEHHQHQHLFGEIEGLIEDTNITPAQVAEELMKSEDPQESLQGFVNLLKRKKMEGDVSENEGHKPVIRQTKKRRVVNNCQQRKTKRICANGSQRRTTRGSSL